MDKLPPFCPLLRQWLAAARCAMVTVSVHLPNSLLFMSVHKAGYSVNQSSTPFQPSGADQVSELSLSVSALLHIQTSTEKTWRHPQGQIGKRIVLWY